MIAHLPTMLIFGAAYALGAESQSLFGGFRHWDLLACAALIMGASSVYKMIQPSTHFDPQFVWPLPLAIIMLVAYRVLYEWNNAEVSFWGETTLPEPNSFVAALIVSLTLVMGLALNRALVKAFPSSF